jgi:serine/threonine protein kinase
MINLIGKTIDRYHILERLGEGGMATVYKAYDTRLERDVAIKIIRTDLFGASVLERMLKRFEREAKSLARLSHPNIIKVIDYGEYEGSPYLVMEYMPGGTLKQKLGKPMPWQDAVRLLIPIAEALEYAHEQKIIHRDVKPSNILLMQKGQPMLTDFGIAKILESDETFTLTGTGIGVGTPEYMAPEQWTGSATAQSDIYSLGVVLYEMLTGRKPYTADTPAAILLKQATEPLPRPTTYVQDLPDAIEKILLKTLARSSENRYEKMEDFLHALNAVASGTATTYATIEQDDMQATRLQEDETQDKWTGTYGQPRTPATRATVQQQKKKTPVWTYVIGGGILGALIIGGILAILFGGNNSTGNYNPSTDNSGTSGSSAPVVNQPSGSSSFSNDLPTQMDAPTYTPLPTYTPQSTFTPLPPPTKIPKPANTSPVIESIELPQNIVCDGSRYNFPIYFHDSDGDANQIAWELIYSKKNTSLDSSPRDFSIDSYAQMNGAVFDDWIEWYTPGDDVQIRVYISDRSGLTGWKDFEFTCSN